MQGKKISLKTGERRWIKKLTGLTALLDDQSIADILLVRSGFKPGALVEISYHPHSSVSQPEFHRAVNGLREILKKLRLYYKLHENYPKTTRARTRYTCIARDKGTLKELVAALANKDVRKRRFEIGMLLGYPETAVAAFASNRPLDNRNLPRLVSIAKEFKFLNFRLSRNWREELGYLRRRAKEIKRLSPELHARILRAPS
ncbi:MAG: hypothetical protein A3A43_00545 [Candidatus Liptonbacteria bacterium RIFCSPLOWO2_01_FULL_56_20]|uniref:Uncharacterized protein n=1 Tax=Candidatus Liptonbacteria bacterium RIFCSPLOWO2_01_FULL_56_20 TaxID=1798652 RepID=A0A1G2CIA0_9BACT|nr:MAG: hypothetical protein A2681_01685 [Candidatus Liptonbacteria bacterium RIFCSPHIGHO2_01_FULL_56_18b]OGZ01116.1 MAG: hypothetical protein A3A43_00545 [Candidatus Liptonbacteria bacterium RIFCSPLOWO2_01_FULL_56_20]